MVTFFESFMLMPDFMYYLILSVAGGVNIKFLYDKWSFKHNADRALEIWTKEFEDLK